MIEYKKNVIPDQSQAEALYLDADRSKCTGDARTLMSAIRNSRNVYTAYDGQRLVGLLRTLSDGLTMLYIQEILVMKSHQHQGIGRRLLQLALEDAKEIRHKVLITDNDEESINYYRACGFAPVEERYLAAMVKLN